MIAAGVIGWPIAHSKSPCIHRFWLDALGLDGDYSRFAVHPDHLETAIRALPSLGLAGVNVTVPHKIAVMAFLGSVDAIAAKVGAVNTVYVSAEGDLIGTNTDVAGFLEPLASIPPPPEGCVSDLYTVIGTGGAARAVVAALQGNEVTVVGRDPSKAAALADELGLGSDYGFSAPLTSLGAAETHKDDKAWRGTTPWAGSETRYRQIIINATTLGMAGQPSLDLDLDRYGPHTIVYDLVYAPLETPLLKGARDRRMQTIDGLAMLIAQAAIAFEHFFGQPPPRDRDPELRRLLTA
jgi:shikimate dehydrogenase